MSSLKNRGIVYVATEGDRYLEEAFISAVSARCYGVDLPIALFTDRADHPLCNCGVFDRLLPSSDPVLGISRWSAGQLRRIRCLSDTPFEQTLYLDTDTCFQTGDLSELFGLLDTADLCMGAAALDESVSSASLGTTLFNVGVIAYRLSPATVQFFTRWSALCLRNFRMARIRVPPVLPLMAHVQAPEMRRRLLQIDQTAMAEMLTPAENRTELQVHLLDYAWNHRGSTKVERNLIRPRITHWPRQDDELHTRTLDWAQRVARDLPGVSEKVANVRSNFGLASHI
jgi:hypothetical protein